MEAPTRCDQPVAPITRAPIGAPETPCTRSLTPGCASILIGEQHNIDPDRWKLVTGESATLMRLARKSYFADDPRLDEAPQDLFLHTEKVLLVDTLGRLRGIYNGTLPFEIAKLLADLKILTQGSQARDKAPVNF